MEYKFHEIADIFPLMSDEEYQGLKSSIEVNGLMVPIVLLENKVLDGRNRYKACQELGIDTKHENFEGTYQEAIEFVWIHNIHRRNLTSSQKAICIIEKDELVKRFRDEAKERQKEHGNTAPGRKNTSGNNSTSDSGKTRDKLASIANTNSRYISDAQKIIKENPEKAQAIKEGKKTIPQAKREIRQEEIKEKTINFPTDKYRVIYADPPWKYGNTMPEYFTEQADHYPLMTITEISELPISNIIEENAVLFLWVTSPILEDAFKIINAWGFKYKASFVWDKVKHNMGHYNSVRHEFLLICVKGSCQPDIQKLFDSVVTEERTKHSKKPEIFREIIDTIYPYGKRIELFAREKKCEGWEVYGNEI